MIKQTWTIFKDDISYSLRLACWDKLATLVPLAFAGARSGQQVIDADVFIEIGPVHAFAPASETPIRARKAACQTPLRSCSHGQ